MLTNSARFGTIARWAAVAVYSFAGLALLVFGIPLASLPFYWEGLARWVPWLLTALPVWLGILSAPGCLTAATRVARNETIGAKWLRFSLWGGLIAATAGTAGGSLMALFIPFGLIGMIGSSFLLYSVDEGRGRPRPFVYRWCAKLAGTIVAVFALTLWALHLR